MGAGGGADERCAGRSVLGDACARGTVDEWNRCQLQPHRQIHRPRHQHRSPLRLSTRYGFGLDSHSQWGDLIIGAAQHGQGGTATILAGLAFQSTQWGGIPARFVLRTVAALNGTGQGFNARMIAAEALSRS